MSITSENPVKKIKKLNFITFTLLLTAVFIYQSTILWQHHYINTETQEFGLRNQERLLAQKIERNLVSSLAAPDYLSRNRYINESRQNINELFINHNALLIKSQHFTLLNKQDTLMRIVYEESDLYLNKMRDAVFMAVANNEDLNYSATQQKSLRKAIQNYQENQQLFINLIEHNTDVSLLNAKDYMIQLPWISWCLVGVILIIMVLNYQLIYRRSVIASKNQFQELEQKLEFQTALLSSTHEAIITFAIDGTVILFSSSACQMFGYAKNEIFNKNICTLIQKNTCPQSQQCHNNTSFSCCNLINIKQQKIEVQGLRQNGELFPLLFEIEELKTAHQHIFIGFMRDLTCEKAIETKLINAKIAAEEANKAKSQFLSNMSHELKTPLNAILGFSQLLKTNDSEPLSLEQTECVQHIYKAGKLLLALISDILDLSKIEIGNVKLNIEEVSVNEVILEALNLMANIADKHHINIKTRFDPLAVTLIKVDDLRFKQIIINLLSNAIKYNSENGLIVLRSKIENNRVRISIKDSGKGIDESKLMELFQPFNRLGAENTEIEGTGIGLCIAKNLVERMGGTIGVINNKDVGCCFWIEFPIIQKKITPAIPINETAQKLHDEITYLQNSLYHIGIT